MAYEQAKRNVNLVNKKNVYGNNCDDMDIHDDVLKATDVFRLAVWSTKCYVSFVVE